jgi:ribosomal protein S18 acetylase RimI-like enzyme
MHEEATLEVLSPADVGEAAAVLARAFRDNPGMIAMLDCDDPARRLRLLAAVFPGFVASYRQHGQASVVRVGGKLVAVALTLGPGRYPPSLRLQWGLTLAVALHVPLRLALRFSAADAWMKRNHMREAHHYLFMLGVEPERQGQGHGGMLLRELSARADADAQPCYLETDKPSSVKLYERHGYVVLREANFVRARDLKLWFMQRAVPAQP